MDGATIEIGSLLVAVVLGLVGGLLVARVLVRRSKRITMVVMASLIAAVLGAVSVTVSTVVDQQAEFDKYRNSFVDARIDEQFEWSFFVATRYKIEAISNRTGDSLGSTYGWVTPEGSPPRIWIQPAAVTMGVVWFVGGLTCFFARRRSVMKA